jgi:DNA polymerase V
MIMHIDGNSFYAACERVFRPDLYYSPIAVLTNNDGIIIALNAECKNLGFKRGDVFFQIKDKLEKKKVKVFSSNYTLYADMSARMNLIYNRFAPEVEVYSIDESFLFFPSWNNADFTEIGQNIKTAVTKETGIPVSIGIAPNKTLAKMCNKLAKKREGIGTIPGLCNWQELNQDEELERYPVGDIWGIGPSKAAFLERQGITTALALKRYPLDKAKKHMTITGFRTVQELNGIQAIDRVEDSPRQVVAVSRSFQTVVYKLDDIITALSEYTQEAVRRIRAENLSCRYITVYLMTNAYAEGEQYFNQMSAEVSSPSAYLPEITAVANELLKRIYRPDYKYRKVMIALTGLTNETRPQLDLFDDHRNMVKLKEPLMKTFDKLNDRYGRGTIKLACGLTGNKPADNETDPWLLKRDYLSPRYTTNIKEIPLIY